MNRRVIVRTLGIAASSALAGCLQSNIAPGGSTSEDNPDETTTEPSAEEPQPTPEPIAEDPRIDEPPYRIDPPDDPDDWNDEYLGEHMPNEPSIPFEVIGSTRLAGSELHDVDRDSFRAEVLRNGHDRDTVLDLEQIESEVRDRLDAVDFDESVLVVVESGFGSSSVAQRWVRVEAIDDGVHLHGFYTDPYEKLDDLESWHSVLEVERPDGLALARASVTVEEDRRIHFNSTEGVVTLEETGSHHDSQ